MLRPSSNHWCMGRPSPNRRFKAGMRCGKQNEFLAVRDLPNCGYRRIELECMLGHLFAVSISVVKAGVPTGCPRCNVGSVAELQQSVEMALRGNIECARDSKSPLPVRNRVSDRKRRSA